MMFKHAMNAADGQDKYSALMEAAHTGNIDSLCFLLEKGANLTDITKSLLIAVENEDEKIVDILIDYERKAMNAANKQDVYYTALAQAAVAGNDASVCFLLNSGADPHIKIYSDD